MGTVSVLKVQNRYIFSSYSFSSSLRNLEAVFLFRKPYNQMPQKSKV